MRHFYKFRANVSRYVNAGSESLNATVDQVSDLGTWVTILGTQHAFERYKVKF